MSRQVCAAVWDRQLRICSTENSTSLSWVAQARFLLEMAEERHRRLLPLDRVLRLVQPANVSPDVAGAQAAAQRGGGAAGAAPAAQAAPPAPVGPGPGGPGGPGGFPPGPPPVPPKLLVFVLDGKAALPNAQQ